MKPSMDWFSWLSKSNLDPSLVYEYGLAFTRNELQAEDTSDFDHEFLKSMGISVAKHRLEILKLARKEHGGGPRPLNGLITAINKTKKSFGKYISKLVQHDSRDEGINKEDLKDSPNSKYREHWRWALSRKQRGEKDMKGETNAYKNRVMRIALSGPLDGSRVQEKVLLAPRSLKYSGPVDSRAQPKLTWAPRSPSPKFLSGPLDGRAQEKVLYPMKSPRLSGPLDARAQQMVSYPNRSPKISGHMDGRAQERFIPRSPRVSGPIERIPLSPKLVCSDLNSSEKMNEHCLDGGYEYDEHSLWSKLFQDMKPT